MYVLFLMEMKQMDIVVSANNGETALILPILPENMPELVEMWNNNTFESINNDINLIGTKGLRTVTLQSFFPVNKNYKFQRAGSEKDGWKYVAFFQKYADLRVPIRMIFLDDMQELSNMAYTIERFTAQINRRKDINYTVELKEYRFIKVKEV